ncbi:nSTAND1 domain-containing NTPase [Hymenobacter ruricola]|uniref:Novel STAND NTPase 1 domain-containing protein n=1 Tax=Hymenobacter ruricola TaxID=2791023 RepID=A0ABS0I6T4_9BACT|nr:hypothetical protein [Hymenobacter ruricola]MBF9222687.1 hypothetical protein [Hymenobacter ruricola]
MAPSPDSDPLVLGADEPICPYTGLRTFTEEEAIYFRGREGHVGKCLALLAAERFVMITGASGDGKSSLVFAGLLPEVRAGFVRARHGTWAVATFRPERSPLHNLARALAPALGLPDQVSSVETELQQGFSALVQLYQTSALNPPAPDPALPAADQRRQQRQAANLLLVVDQFEEFFTNPENYEGDAPNAAAQTTVNLLLETARLAREQQLPLYIVCTMRSDFVGQCAEFRGLIEQVGASQYFVPRLLRHEFAQVIRDPALLSGNRISERLVQRLLLDTDQGQDQLPVLQHALRRIWLAADEGREQMDLLHYAMVGGLSDELPPADRPRFEAWKATLPPAERGFLLDNPGLRNVLDAHANQLHFEANDLYNRDFAPPLPPGTAERVIEQTFRVLTRTDGQRVVRNRLTGAQITAIIDDPLLPWPVICRILRPFRRPDSTFLSPFLSEDEDDRAVLPPDAVLDISHESLIRNWQHLSAWSKTEAQNVRIAANLLQEAARWQASDESVGFLLPIGLYTFFAQWVAAKGGLTAWLAYYYQTGSDPAQRLAHAEELRALLARYLQKSKNRLWAQLQLARYGVRRLLLAVLLPLVLGGLAWTAWQWRQRQDDYVAYNIVEQRAPLLTSSYVPVREKALFVLAADRLGGMAYTPWLGGRAAADYAFPRMLDALHNDTLALNIELGMFSAVDRGGLSFDSVERENPIILRLLHDLTHRLDQAGGLTQLPAGPPAPGPQQRALAVLTARAVMALTYYQLNSEQQRTGLPAPPAARAAEMARLLATRARLLERLRAYVAQEVRTAAGAPPSPVALSFCLRVLLGQGTFAPAQLAFLEGMNPYGTAAARAQFQRLYSPTYYLYDERGAYTGNSGGYLTAAIVLAALRQPAQVQQCLAQLKNDAVNIREIDGAFVLLPYLVKYELLTPTNVYPLLNACSQVGNFSLNEAYSALVYSLLSVRPVNRSHDVSQPYSPVTLNQVDVVRLGGVNPAVLNIDRVSFSIPLASRDKAWQAVLAATPVVADHATIFTVSSLGQADILRVKVVMSENKLPPGLNYLRYLFMSAFAAPLYATYLQEFKHQPAEAARTFARAAAEIEQLNSLLDKLAAPRQKGQEGPIFRLGISPWHWNLGPNQSTQVRAIAEGEDPIAFLRQPSRPKTRDFGGFYTCPFDAFFAYEVRQLAASPNPLRGEIDQLDSLAFVEAVFPDRYSRTRTRSLWAEAMSRPPQFQPNLVWLRAVARYQMPGDTLRRRRNAVLLTVSEALQDTAKLQRIRLTPALRRFLQEVDRQPRFCHDLLLVLFSDLAAALAHAGRTPEAFALAKQLDLWDEDPTQLRVAEQVLLTGRSVRPAQADSFLLSYGERIRLSPQTTPLNAFALFYSRSYLTTPHAGQLRDIVNRLAEEVNAPSLFCERAIGYTLAGQSHLAVREAPTYLPEQQRQMYFNNILVSLAHLHTQSHADGWHEYDHTMICGPIPGTPDYIGPMY